MRMRRLLALLLIGLCLPLSAFAQPEMMEKEDSGRVNRALNYGAGGYQRVLDKMVKRNTDE